MLTRTIRVTDIRSIRAMDTRIIPVMQRRSFPLSVTGFTPRAASDRSIGADTSALRSGIRRGTRDAEEKSKQRWHHVRDSRVPQKTADGCAPQHLQAEISRRVLRKA